MRATLANLKAGHAIQGGSTITEQYIKNTLLNNDQTITRKFNEAVLAWQMEQKYTKEEILTKYLNTVYFGQGAYGIQAAARSYFAIDAMTLGPRGEEVRDVLGGRQVGDGRAERDLQRLVPEEQPAHLVERLRQRSAQGLRARYPRLLVEPLAADYGQGLLVPAPPAGARQRVGFFPGSTIGNFTPHEAIGFLQDVRRMVGAGIPAGARMRRWNRLQTRGAGLLRGQYEATGLIGCKPPQRICHEPHDSRRLGMVGASSMKARITVARRLTAPSTCAGSRTA